MSDEKIVSLAKRRKSPIVPGCASQMASVTDVLRTLLQTMESEGKASLVACCDGFDVSIKKSKVE